MERFKQAFIRFRGGNIFIYCMLAFLVGWGALQWVGVISDPDHGLLNLILSIEAAIATCLLLDQSTKQAERDREMLSAELELARETYDEVEQVHEILTHAPKSNP